MSGTALALAQFVWPVGEAFLLPYYARLLTTAGLLIGRGRRSSPERDVTTSSGSTR